ncbi:MULTISPECIES: cysteine-rich KTR domain-containing protein [Clostridium]|uniref:Cysteine-rich KTR domain-containing protein n=1 Tax=Clostridium frigoriphilum TaxID=443253 RepID=A0ABU7UP35_9CLOT|nr:cysteine-rich KTR domain-containing protein [Clostridium sp. DSM 17811]MBU3099394.1 cysteine-rich KTR domain-containing protein [Clostridium sp. DSM 17811]
MCEFKWIIYSICGNKTRIQVRVDTLLVNFSLLSEKESDIITKKWHWKNEDGSLSIINLASTVGICKRRY